MSDIILSSSVRSNLLSLQNTSELLGKTQERLATGLKVNSALDDPSAFFTAAGLNNRAGDLNRLLDSVGLAVRTLEAADTAISALTDLVETAQGAARQALQSPGPGPLNATVTGTGASITADANALVTGTGASVLADEPGQLNGSGAALSADAVATVTGTVTGIGAETDIISNTGISQSNQLQINGSTITFGIGAGEVNTGAALEAAIDLIAGVSASYDGSGRLVIQSSDADSTIDIGVGTTNAVETALGISVAVTDPTNLLTQGAVTQGQTFTVQFGTNNNTITFGTAGGQVSTLAELSAQLGALTGGSGSVDGSGNISVVTGNADDTVTIGGSATLSNFGLAPGSDGPTNLLTQGAVSAGETLSIQIGTNANVLVFGNSGGQISTLAELSSALGALTGGTGSVDGSGNITVQAGNDDDAITISGSTTLGTFGLSSGQTDPTDLLSQSIAAQGETLLIDIGLNSTAITFGTDDGAGEVSTLAELSTALGSVAGGTASIDGSGNLTVTAGNIVDSVTIAGTVDTTGFGVAAGTTPPVGGVGANNAQRAALETEYNSLLGQIDALAADASFNGNNLLQGDDLTVIFNEDGTSALTIAGVDFDASGLGISTPTTDAFQTDANISTALGELDSAISSLRTQASTFGSNLSVVEVRQDFTKELINVLETGAGGLTLADTNEEGANLLSLQTRQQLSTISLSLATQADQNVLRLF